MNQVSEPQSSTVLAANGKDAVSTSLDLASKHKPSVSESVTGSKTTSSVAPAEMLCVYVDGDGTHKVLPTNRISPGQSTEATEVDLGLIPPPSDFMDDPSPPAQSEKVKDLHPPLGKPTNKPGATVDLEQLRQRASVKRTLVSSSVAQENQPKVSLSLNQPALTSDLQMGPPPEAAEPRGPPVVAPKPKKLPANIILKSHKVSSGSESNSGNSIPTSSDRVLLDPQRVRIEALRKLGLIKSVETDSDPSLSPKHSPKDRRSWPAPSSPVIPGAPHTPPLTPSSIHVNTPPPASVSSQSPAAVSPLVNSTAPPVQLSSDILPAPAAFSDPVELLVFDNKLSDVSEAKVNALANTPPLTPPALTKQLTPLKISGVKSVTLERYGPDLSSYMAAQDSRAASQGVRGEENPSQLRNSRPRPASLGSGKEFSSAQGEALQAHHASSKESDLRRSLHAQTASQQSRDSQKLPRSQGISVLISPRAENGEDRRKALKKLGLLRD